MLVLVIAALVASCGHPGRQSAERPGSRAKRRRRGLFSTSTLPPCPTAGPWPTNDHSGFTDLLTSHDGGRRWHDVTPPVVLAGEEAEIATRTPAWALLTPFVLNSRDAWLPVGRSYGTSLPCSTCS